MSKGTMSAADLHDLELIWPSLGPADVIVTGTFDQVSVPWMSSVHMVKGDGGFFGTVKVPWGQKIAYKYIVDGQWQCRDDKPQEEDGHGNINNVLLTPEKPVLPTLFIPADGVGGDSHGDVEAMVTAVEFLTPAESTAIKGLLPLPIPQITVDLSRTPGVREANLDTAAATEGEISPASRTPAVLVQELSSSDVLVLPVDDSSVLPAPVDDIEDVRDSNGFSTQAPVQLTEVETPAFSSMTEAAEEAAGVPSEFQPNHSSQAAQDGTAVVDRVDALPAAVVEPVAKQPEVDLPEAAAQDQHLQATVPASVEKASTSTIPSSTSGHKKRRSLFARIMHIFDKDKNKQDKKKKH